MRRLPALFALAAVLNAPAWAWAAATVSAGQAEAKEAARSGNCSPNKVEVLEYGYGRQGVTIFKVSCNESKDSAVLVQCRARMCTLLR